MATEDMEGFARLVYWSALLSNDCGKPKVWSASKGNLVYLDWVLAAVGL